MRCVLPVLISIHALLAESDYPITVRLYNDSHFYPRSPCGERLEKLLQWLSNFAISIHALLAESDSNKGGKDADNGNFYPRSPCGERPA